MHCNSFFGLDMYIRGISDIFTCLFNLEEVFSLLYYISIALERIRFLGDLSYNT